MLGIQHKLTQTISNRNSSIRSLVFNPVYSVYNKLGFFLFERCRIFNEIYLFRMTYVPLDQLDGKYL